MFRKIFLACILLSALFSQKSAHADSPVELLECDSCTTTASLNTYVRSVVKLRAAGEYHIAVFNTSKNIISQYKLEVEREFGMVTVASVPEAINLDILNSFNYFVSKYPGISKPSITLDVNCPASEARCGSRGDSAFFLDVQSYARGTPAVISATSGIIRTYKIEKGKMDVFVKVHFSDGVVWTLKLTSVLSTIAFELVDVKDKDGNIITSFVTSGGGSGGGGGYVGGGSVYIVGGSLGGTGGVDVIVCDNSGDCKRTTVY